MPDTDEALTLGELHRSVRSQLERAGVAEPAVSARHIVAAASGVQTTEVALEAQMPMTVGIVARADAMTKRRATGEPLQYVLGSWGFRKLDLATDHRALIPRPETEAVAGVAIDWLTARVRDGQVREPVVADLGTGCGAIALSIAQEVPTARVHATDSSPEALSLAGDNLAGLGRAAARISLHLGSWFDALANDAHGLHERLDVVVANPPYVAYSEGLPAEVAQWEPHAALYAPSEGLFDLLSILRTARGWLAPGGLLILECAPHQAASLGEAARARGYEHVRIERDLAGRERALVAQRPDNEPSTEVIDAAARTLRSGGFVVAPTDTLCGIMACYSDADAVAAVCAAKQRPPSEPMPILVSGASQAAELVELSLDSHELARRHWPGGLTLVARRLGGPDPLHGRDTLGVRAPALGWLRWLIDEVGPVTGTSANLHGAPTPADASQAAAALATPPTAVIGGRAAGGTASTVVDTTGPTPVVLRAGAVPAEHLPFTERPDR